MASSSILSGFDRARWLSRRRLRSRPVSRCSCRGRPRSPKFSCCCGWSRSCRPCFCPMPTSTRSAQRLAHSRPAFLPIVLCALAAVGMLWATDVSWAERLGGFAKFPRLMLIPLLLAHFARSERGMWVLYGFLAATVLLLLVSLGPGGAARLALARQGVRRSGQRLYPPEHVLYGLRLCAPWRGGRTRARGEMAARPSACSRLRRCFSATSFLS